MILLIYFCLRNDKSFAKVVINNLEKNVFLFGCIFSKHYKFWKLSFYIMITFLKDTSNVFFSLSLLQLLMSIDSDESQYHRLTQHKQNIKLRVALHNSFKPLYFFINKQLKYLKNICCKTIMSNVQTNFFSMYILLEQLAKLK